MLRLVLRRTFSTAKESMVVEKPHVARKIPYTAELKEGKKYSWCSCGLSSKQPFCDGSHRGTPFEPVRFTAEKDGKKLMCGCKRTKSENGYCDLTHLKVIGAGLIGREIDAPVRSVTKKD